MENLGDDDHTYMTDVPKVRRALEDVWYSYESGSHGEVYLEYVDWLEDVSDEDLLKALGPKEDIDA